MKYLSLLLFVFCFATLTSQTPLEYYFPELTSLNKGISTPYEHTGYRPGDWHFSHDQLLSYVRQIASESERVELHEYARSWENRPLVYLLISSPANLEQKEELRRNHLHSLESGERPKDNTPLFIHLGYGVHGNESSASNAAMITLYYLAASKDPFMERLLDEVIIILDPCLNPDGFHRHSTWVNMNESQTPVTDSKARQFNEPWPGARTNHYWFDLNRDYVPLVHPESKGRIQLYHQWKPHILTDHHEMGANSTFFFQPGVPSRNNPLTPAENYRLTEKIASYHAQVLDSLGVPYFTKERFDDYYYGKGSSYPDGNGGIGILFEQAGYRGHQRETIHGIKTFASAVRNQFNVSLSTLRAGLDMKDELINYQINFFREARKEAGNSEVKAYVFGEKHDMTRLGLFTELLQSHQIQLRSLQKPVLINGRSYQPGEGFIVPVDQLQYRLIRSFFEPVSEFTDTTFYDVSTWHLPKAFNMDYREVSSVKELSDLSSGETGGIRPDAGVHGKGNLALLMKWDEHYSPAALYSLQENKLRTFVSKESFSIEGMNFRHGTIMVPLSDQVLSKEQIIDMAVKLSEDYKIEFYRISTFYSDSGISLGSGNMVALKKPAVALVSGPGTPAYTVGEIWHMLDVNYNIPVSLINSDDIRTADLDRYNVLILTGWNYDYTDIEGLNSWIMSGGLLLSSGWNLNWLDRNELLDVDFEDPARVDPDREFPYSERARIGTYHRIAGSIFQIEADITHPLFYGYYRPLIPVFKNSTSVILPEQNRYAHPAKYTDSPLLSGYSSAENVGRISQSPFCLIQSHGSGRIIHLMDNTQFRGKWYGTQKIFANALFFSEIF